MRDTINLFLICFLFLNVYSCDSTTEPREDNIEPGRRDYEWTVDTISAPAGSIFYLWNIWGSDTGNIWIVGQGDAPYNLWHYDGNNWKSNSNNIGSIISIYGFDRNSIWAVGGSCVSYGSNINWAQYECFELSNNQTNFDISLSNIWGSSPDNIYAVGGGFAYTPNLVNISLIFHFDGVKWKQKQISTQDVIFTSIKKNSFNDKYYLSSTKLGVTVPDTNKIYEFDGTNLKEVWSGTEIATTNNIRQTVYLAIGKKIYKPESGNLKLWKDFSNTTYLGRVWGRSEKDFFGVASDGLTHYNGTDLKTIYPMDLFINDVFVMEKDIFMLCENRIIIHGKLKVKAK